MNFRDRNYMITSSSMESLKGVAFLSKILGILRGKRVPTPHAELVAVVNRRFHSLTVVSAMAILRQQLAHHFHGLSTRALKGHILVKGSMAQPGG